MPLTSINKVVLDPNLDLPTNTTITITMPVVPAGNNVTNVDYVSLLISSGANPELTAISSLSTTGLLARAGSANYQTRTILGSADIDVADGDGVASNPTLSLTTTGVSPGTYNNVTVDLVGRVTNGTNTTYVVPGDLSSYVLGTTLSSTLLGYPTIAQAKSYGMTSSGPVDVTASRALAINYTNSFGKAIFVMISGTWSAAGSASVLINGSTVITSAVSDTFTFVVPDTLTYQLQATNFTITSWWELQ